MGDELIAAIKSARPEEGPAIVEACAERFPDTVSAWVPQGRCSGSFGPDPFGDGFVNAAELQEGVQIQPLWFGIYPGWVTYLVGEMGAGKSSLLYNVALHGALGKPYLGHAFGAGEPLRVLYLDPENAGSYRDGQRNGGLCAQRMDRIGAGRPPNLWFHDGLGVDLAEPTTLMYLEGWVRANGVNLLIIDPISALFHTVDENSNAEASRHMTAIREFARRTRCAVIAVHHLGKSGGEAANSAPQYGRGATARLGLADVGMMLRARHERESADDEFVEAERARADLCRLQVTKDRGACFGLTSIYCRMVGQDRFERASASDWHGRSGEDRPARQSAQAKATQFVSELLALNRVMLRTAILKAAKHERVGAAAVDKALSDLVELGVVTRKSLARNAAEFTWHGSERAS